MVQYYYMFEFLTLPILLILVLSGVGLFIWFSYNSLVTLKMRVKEAWADIDVQLKKRYDLLPDLIETARKATVVDEDILTKVTKLRTEAMSEASKNLPPDQRGKVESQISSALGDIKVQVEAYPDIKSHQELVNLMDKVTEIEEKIAYARRFYNGNVRDFNTRIKLFPVVIIATFLGFEEEKFFEATESEREDIKVDFDKK